MYNDVNIKFLPRGWEKGFSQKEEDVLAFFDSVFQKNKEKGFKKSKEGVYKLKITNSSEGADEIFDQLKKMKNNINFIINVNTKYDSTDFESAVAYLLKFEKKYEYYDDWNEDDYNSFKLVCGSKNVHELSCKTWDHTDKIYVKPHSGLKKYFEDFAGATNYELSEDSIISDRLYEYLLHNNIEEKYFKPVFNKKGERWSFFLDGSSSVLESKSLKCNTHSELEVCPKCGRRIWRIDEDVNDLFSSGFGNQIVLGNPNVVEYWTLTQHGVDKLGYVNSTSDYFSANRLTIVNKDFFNLIKEKVPGVTKYTIPIFKGE